MKSENVTMILLPEFQRGFELGKQFAAFEQDLIERYRDWACCQPLNEEYEGKVERANAAIKEYLDKWLKDHGVNS